MRESELQTKIKDKLTKSGWLIVKLENASFDVYVDFLNNKIEVI